MQEKPERRFSTARSWFDAPNAQVCQRTEYGLWPMVPSGHWVMVAEKDQGIFALDTNTPLGRFRFDFPENRQPTAMAVG